MEVCKWDAATQQQFRFQGPVTVVDADNNDETWQSIRQEEWRKVGTPSTLQWYQNAERAPGHAYKPPAQFSIDKQVWTHALPRCSGNKLCVLQKHVCGKGGVQN